MKRLADQSLYEILEVAPDATADAIEAAYDKARALYGPGSIVTYTLMEPDEAALLEARIEDARATLLDPDRRARYDESLQQRQAEPRAMASGGGALTALPPVLPAAPPPAPPPAAREAPPAQEPEARPAVLLEGALGAAGPAAAEPERPAPGPILLERVARELAPTPTSTPTPTPTPTSTSTSTSTRPPAVAAGEGSDDGVVAPPHPVAHAAAAPPPATAAPLPDTWTGEALRQVREARGLSVQQISERTKVTRHHIENVEGDRFSALPAQVYLRGILLALARELRLDGQKVARSYLERLGGNAAAPAAPSKPR